ncbi:MAG: hypothetical protein RLZZ511_1951 [Cyanobacteriota bacterium]|jgi:uncharacterized membrane protein
MFIPHPLLIAAVFVGLILRLLNLTGKPLWMDEVITQIFSLGQTYDVITTGSTRTVAVIAETLQFTPSTCAAITSHVMVQSVHPPLFFCTLHQWLALLQHSRFDIIWQMRSFAALLGTATIGLAYAIGRVAFRSQRIALGSAWVMAVSPFAIYLSQEARHYTMPMAIVMLGLLCLSQIQQDWRNGMINPWVWIGWTIAQTLGLYTHYFCVMATIGQIGALLIWQWYWKRSGGKSPFPAFWVPVAFVITAISFNYAPWIRTMVSHVTRPETNWMKSFEPNLLTALAPLWQLPIGWLSMVVAFPVEGQALWKVIPTAIVMLGFGLWIVQQTAFGLRQLWRDRQQHHSLILIGSFLSIVLIEFFIVIFGLGKDIAQVPRYNFIYYPAVCLLVGAGLVAAEANQPKSPDRSWQPLFALILVGSLSAIFINANLAFQKPFRPEQVASRITRVQSPATVVMGYESYQELALGMSFVLALREVEPRTKFLFLDRSTGYESIFKIFPKLVTNENFWLIGPGLRQRDFPNLTEVGNRQCRRMPEQYYRIGIPYQGYQCTPPEKV